MTPRTEIQRQYDETRAEIDRLRAELTAPTPAGTMRGLARCGRLWDELDWQQGRAAYLRAWLDSTELSA